MPALTFENRFSAEDDAKIIYLKEERNLPWADIANHFCGRSKGSLQVRYSRALSKRKKNPNAVYNPKEDISEVEASSESLEDDETSIGDADHEMDIAQDNDNKPTNSSSNSNVSVPESNNGHEISNQPMAQTMPTARLTDIASDDDLTYTDRQVSAEITPSRSAASGNLRKEASVKKHAHSSPLRQTRQQTVASASRSAKAGVNAESKRSSLRQNKSSNSTATKTPASTAPPKSSSAAEGWQEVTGYFVAHWANDNPDAIIPRAFLEPQASRIIEYNARTGSFRTKTRQEHLLEESSQPQQVDLTNNGHKRQKNTDRSRPAARKVNMVPIQYKDSYVSDTEDNSTVRKRGKATIYSKSPASHPSTPQDQARGNLSSRTRNNFRRADMTLHAGERSQGRLTLREYDETESEG